MAAIHRIRLRGPWQFRVVRTGPVKHVKHDDETASRLREPPDREGTTRLPTPWHAPLGPGFRGRVRYTRHFHRPTGLEVTSRVCIVVAGPAPVRTVTLNGARLTAVDEPRPDQRYLIEGPLLARNELTVEVELPVDLPVSPPVEATKRSVRPGRDDRRDDSPAADGQMADVWLEIR